MGKTDRIPRRFGLVGKNIEYSFSRAYFSKKFKALGLQDHSYENFDLKNISDFPEILQSNGSLGGLNVTIPYKEAVIPYLDTVDAKAAKIGAVNTIQFSNEGLIGHNTDAFGFRESLLPMLRDYDKFALILGTGGASKAIAFTLDELGISYSFVSRNPTEDQLRYTDLDQSVMKKTSLVINCTPLGTYPKIELRPDIPYELLNDRHFLFDLIYNPETTCFLQAGRAKGARTMNGLRMLELQAEKAWEIWNE